MKDLSFYALIKFGNKENILDMYNNGTIYLNTIEYFKNHYDNLLRGDNYEGIMAVKNIPPSKFDMIIKNKTVLKGLHHEGIHIAKSYERVIGNIYSMYAIRPEHLLDKNIFTIDMKNQAFGSHFLLIHSNAIQVFLDKIFDEIKKKRTYYEFDFVEYYNKFSINRETSIFMKSDEYSYQNEFRIYVNYLIDEPLILRIGSLRDISLVFETKDLPGFQIVRS